MLCSSYDKEAMSNGKNGRHDKIDWQSWKGPGENGSAGKGQDNGAAEDQQTVKRSRSRQVHSVSMSAAVSCSWQRSCYDAAMVDSIMGNVSADIDCLLRVGTGHSVKTRQAPWHSSWYVSA